MMCRVRLTLDADIWTRALDYARGTNRTPSELVQEALEQIMARYPKRPRIAATELDVLAGQGGGHSCATGTRRYLHGPRSGGSRDVNEPWRRVERIGDATLYLGDCLEVLPTLGPVDAVVTDPPYGIAYVHGHEKSRWASRHNEVPVAGDNLPFDPAPFLAVGETHVFWGANHYSTRLPDGGGRWIIWDKRVGTVQNDQSDCEIAWCDAMTTDRMIWHMWNGWCRASERDVPRDHPTQKPVRVMERCIELAGIPAGSVVLDPFMGSGTTGVACANLGRRFIGIEIEERYFDIACRRIRDAYAQGRLFDDKPVEPVQLELEER